MNTLVFDAKDLSSIGEVFISSVFSAASDLASAASFISLSRACACRMLRDTHSGSLFGFGAGASVVLAEAAADIGRSPSRTLNGTATRGALLPLTLLLPPSRARKLHTPPQIIER